MDAKTYFPIVGCTNVQASIEADKMYLKVDLNHKGPVSSSGKTKLLASSHGGRALVNSGLTFSGNIYHPVNKKAGGDDAPAGPITMTPGNHKGLIAAGHLYVEIDLSSNLGESKSGNTILVLNVALFKITGTNLTAGLTMYHKKGVKLDLASLATLNPAKKVSLDATQEAYVKALQGEMFEELDKADNVAVMKSAPLRVHVDLSEDGETSASEKSILVASTHGGLPAFGYKLSVNLYHPVDKESGHEGALPMVFETPEHCVVSVLGSDLFLDFSKVAAGTTVQYNSPVHGTTMSLGVRASTLKGAAAPSFKDDEGPSKKVARKEPAEPEAPLPAAEDIKQHVASQLEGLSEEEKMQVKLPEFRKTIAEKLGVELTKPLGKAINAVLMDFLTSDEPKDGETKTESTPPPPAAEKADEAPADEAPAEKKDE